MPRDSELIGIHLKWPIDRKDKTFRAFIVQPAPVAPAVHASIFFGAINGLLSPEPLKMDGTTFSNTIDPIHFDLLTFPEAFLPSDALLQAFRLLHGRGEPTGCIHVGIRPGDQDGHLFSPAILTDLLDRAAAVEGIDLNDIAQIREWAAGGDPRHRYNIGCLFSIDAQKKLRVCFHPKMLPSKYEGKANPERDMTPGNVLSLVTLIPECREYATITLQPLICSDMLRLDPDVPGRRPLDALNRRADCFDERIPDHVDIVSVATWTPHVHASAYDPAAPPAKWHPQFLGALTGAASDAEYEKHSSAIFVLSNFLLPESTTYDGRTTGGLSGVYLPLALRGDEYPPFVDLRLYGRYEGEIDNVWLSDPGRLGRTPQVRATLMQLRSRDRHGADMLGFIVPRLPRHQSAWSPAPDLRQVRLLEGSKQGPGDRHVFREVQS